MWRKQRPFVYAGLKMKSFAQGRGRLVPAAVCIATLTRGRAVPAAILGSALARASAFVLACLLISTSPGASAEPALAVVVENHKSAWRISSPAPGSPRVNWAAQELQKYVHQMAGYKLLIVKKAGNKSAIVVGLRSELSSEDRALLPPPAQGYDGYAITIQPPGRKIRGRIIIGGDNGRGVIYGVYDLLERFGCRWFYPTEDAADPEVVPRQSGLSLPAGSWAVASPMKYRICNGSEWFFELDPAPALKQLDWAMKARYNAMGWQGDTQNPLEKQYQQLAEGGLLAELSKREMLLHGPAHSFNLLLRAEDYMTNHPEWFGMRNGKRVPQTFAGAQFCWSNPDARKKFTDNVEAFARHAPQIHILCLVPFDGGQACECDVCKKAGASNLLMLLMGEIIERLSSVRPDLLVETVGGYGAVNDPPDTAQIHPRQRVVWAHWGRGYTSGYDDPHYGRKANLEKWRRAARGGITICQYYTDNFAEPWVMSPFTVAMEGDRRYFLTNGIDSIYLLMWPRGYWWNHSLNGYLAGRCFYDCSLSPYDLLGDYARHYFGDDAGPLLGQYFEAWARNPDLCYRVRGESRDSDRAALASQRQQWIDPATTLAAHDPVMAYRVAKVARLHGLAEQLMEVHRRRDEIQSLRRAGEFEKARVALDKARPFTDEVIALFYTLADLNQGLIERKEIPSFITANVKNWLEEEAKAVTTQKRD